jgi:hypothetical protein
MSREDLRAFHPIFGAPAAELVDLERSLEGRSLPGGTARSRVLSALDQAEREAREQLAALDAAS